MSEKSKLQGLASDGRFHVSNHLTLEAKCWCWLPPRSLSTGFQRNGCSATAVQTSYLPCALRVCPLHAGEVIHGLGRHERSNKSGAQTIKAIIGAGLFATRNAALPHASWWPLAASPWTADARLFLPRPLGYTEKSGWYCCLEVKLKHIYNGNSMSLYYKIRLTRGGRTSENSFDSL